jgi:Flp pilus assembly pilin Flp
MIPGVSNKLLLREKGQSLTEAALIIGIVGLVLIGMQAYLTRGIQSKLKGLTDNMVGTEQSVYQQDDSGYEINTSSSRTTQDSVAVSRQDKGGGRIYTTEETVFIASESNTEDQSF